MNPHDPTSYGVLANYVDGRRLEVQSHTRYPVYNPAFGRVIA
jgi:hypothetical protein